MDENTARNLNLLGRFLGVRDLLQPDRASLIESFGLDQVDVMVLFGGSILAGGDVMAKAIRENLARTFVIVGGAGHTTQTLRDLVNREYPFLETQGLPEAGIFQRYLQKVHGCQADYLEVLSTNCGNNITHLLSLLDREQIPFKSILLCQDATMQRRMEAGFRRYGPGDTLVISYAAYEATVRFRDGRLSFEEGVHGMWEMDRYIELLMGEIPRLRDDAEGYGPKGKGFIAHVEIPGDVREAFEALKVDFKERIRPADPRWATQDPLTGKHDPEGPTKPTRPLSQREVKQI